MPLVRLLTLLLMLAAAAPRGAAAAAPAEDGLVRALPEAPALQAAAQRVAAARARIDAAGRLPDPEVEGMGSRMDGPMGESSTMYEVNLRQPLPRRGERAADRERAAAAVAMAEAEWAAMAAELAADTAMALAEAGGAFARITLLESQLARLDAVLRSIEAQLATATTGRLADRLTVQTRAAALQLMIEEERRMAEDALAAARGRLGWPPDRPLPGYAAPAPGSIDPAMAAEVQLARARAAEAGAMLKMAHASGRPMTAVGLRFERERSAMGDEDTVGLAFMSEIPWRGRRYARAEARAAAAERSAAEDDAAAVRYRVTAALSRVERAQRLAETARRLKGETLQRLDAEYDTMVRSASVSGMGGSAVLQTVEVLERATEAQLQVLAAETAARVAQAELWRYAPVSSFFSVNP